MRPLKMRGLKKGSSSNGTVDGDSRSSADKKEDGDLKITETDGDGDGVGEVGEVDVLSEVRSDDGLLRDEGVPAGSAPGALDGEGDAAVYKVYKRRWFGLVQLVLLNIIVSWDVSIPLLLIFRNRWLMRGSGFPSQRIPIQWPNTMIRRNRLSIGSAQASSLHSWSRRPLQSSRCTAADLNRRLSQRPSCCCWGIGYAMARRDQASMGILEA